MNDVRRWIKIFKDKNVIVIQRDELVKEYAQKYGIENRASSDRLRHYEEFEEDLVDEFGDNWRELSKLVYFYRSGGRTKGGRVEWTGREPVEFDW